MNLSKKDIRLLEEYKRSYDMWNLKVNNKIFHMDIKSNLNEILVHHYLVSQMRLNCSYEANATLKEISYKTNLGLQQVRTAINKLEELGVIEIIKGSGRTPSIYRYIDFLGGLDGE